MSAQPDNIGSIVSSKTQKEQEDYLHKIASERAKKRELELNVLLQQMLSITKGRPIVIDNSKG